MRRGLPSGTVTFLFTDVEGSTRVLASSQALHEELGAAVRPSLAAENQETLGMIRSQLDKAAYTHAWEHGRTLSADDAVALALTLQHDPRAWQGD